MGKGEQTKRTILGQALSLASQVGLHELSIGGLAARTGLSKSGLFAHFGSKEDLQLAVVRAAEERFVAFVVMPALKKPRGLPRLEALMSNWVEWTAQSGLPGGCPLVAAAIEFDDKSGPVRDAIAAGQRQWRTTLANAVRKGVEAGHLRADIDADQFVFEMVGIALVADQSSRLFRDPEARNRALSAFQRLVAAHRPVSPSARHD